METTKKELSYFRLKLETYLGKHFPEILNDRPFVTVRSDEALVIYYMMQWRKVFHFQALHFLFLSKCSTICEDNETDAVPFLSAKVVRGLWLPQGRKSLVYLKNLYACGVYFPSKPCASSAPLPRFCYKKE